MEPLSPAAPRLLSLRKLRDSHIEEFHQKLLLEAAQNRGAAVETLPQEVHQALHDEAIKAANERVELLRKHGKVQKRACNSPAGETEETSASGNKGRLFINTDSLPDDPSSVTRTTPVEDSRIIHQPIQPAAPLLSSSPFNPEIYYDLDNGQRDPSPDMSVKDLYSYKLTSEEESRLDSLTPAILQHPQVLADISQPATEGQTQGGNDIVPDLFGNQHGLDRQPQSFPQAMLQQPQDVNRVVSPGSEDPFMGYNTDIPSSPLDASYQIQGSPLTRKSTNIIAQGDKHSRVTSSPAPSFRALNMSSPQIQVAGPSTSGFGDQEQASIFGAVSNNIIAQGDRDSFRNASPMPTFHADNTPSQFEAAGPTTAFGQIPQPINGPSLPPEPTLYDPRLLVDPWENSITAKTPADAKNRFVFHVQRLNLMHELRKQANNKYSFTWVEQGHLVVSTIIQFVAVSIGFHTANELIAKYNETNDPRELLHLITHLRYMMIPKLRTVGPVNIRNSLNVFTHKITDPQYKVSCYNHVATAIYQMFCGIKGFMLMIDRHREMNPAQYAEALPAFKFETYFTVGRKEFWEWLAPINDDKELGEFDHWFGH